MANRILRRVNLRDCTVEEAEARVRTALYDFYGEQRRLIETRLLAEGDTDGADVEYLAGQLAHLDTIQAAATEEALSAVRDLLANG